MKIEEFISIFKEELEIEEAIIDINTNIKDLDEWDSLTGLMLIGFVANKFDVTLNLDDIQSISTIQSLLEKIGLNKFN